MKRILLTGLLTFFTITYCLPNIAVAESLTNSLVVSVPFTGHGKNLIVQGPDNPKGSVVPFKIKSVPGVIGKAIAFDGVKNQVAKISSKPLFEIRNELTLSLWVKPDSIGHTQTFITRNWSWEIGIDSGGMLRVMLQLMRPNHKLKTFNFYSAKTIPAGKWTYLCLTFSLSHGKTVLYVNGQKAGHAKVKFPLRDEGKNPLIIGAAPSNYSLYKGAVDELRVYNRALSSNEIKKLYARQGERLLKSAANKWNNQLEQRQKLVEQSADTSLKSSYQAANSTIKKFYTEYGIDNYWAAEDAVKEFDSALYDYRLQKKVGGKQGVSGAVCFVVRPFSSRPILPKTRIGQNLLSGSIDLTGSPLETLTGSFVLKPMKENAKGLTIKTGALKASNNNNLIPSSAIDIRVVKNWYQASGAWQTHKFGGYTPVLVPELLLHDASLVKVDYSKKKNYLKLKDSNGVRYVDISGHKQRKLPGSHGSSWINNPVNEFPVADDTKTLQPLSIKKSQNQQFWLNIKLPDDAKPGTYKGKLKITSYSGINGHINIKVHVLPIKLSQPKTHYNPKKKYYHSVYYRGMLSPDGKAYIGSEYKSKIQYIAEMKDLRSHGIDFVSNRSPLSQPDKLNESLAIQQRILGGDILFNTGSGYNLGIRLRVSKKAFVTLKNEHKNSKK